MSQPPPPLLKHPAAPSPTPNVAQGPNGAAASAGAQFIPRREFIRDHRIASSFSLLALSGSGFVRLYSFSPTVITALRRLFDHRDLISSVREYAPKHFFEFSLEGKPWSNAKSITSEKLIIDVLRIILHCGYIFLSTIDYGREPDDKLAVIFSRPQVVPQGPFLLSEGSAISLNPSVLKTPFAISFSSATLLRVVGPPLHSTPAVLQAVRGAWPRGVVSEKKVGDETYEFKLKGYKWFQEDTFATDSLHHILGLLTALDGHGFSLLTSLSLNGRSRAKDLWIFTGDHHVEDQSSSPSASNTDLRREITPQQHSGAAPSPLHTTPPRTAHGYGNGDAEYGHKRHSSDPVTPSPLKPTKGQNTLHKPSPKAPIPVAFVPEYAQSSIPRPTGLAPSPPPTGQIVRSISKPSSVGSVDMTGIGSGLSRSMELLHSPDVFYTIDDRQHGPSSYFPPQQDVSAPTGPFLHKEGRRVSADSKAGSRRSSRPSLLSRSTTLPSPTIRQPSLGPKIQVHAPSPVKATDSGHAFINGERSSSSRRGENGLADKPPAKPVPTPTPPLLDPSAFAVRDSAYSSATAIATATATQWTQAFPWVADGDLFLPEPGHTRRDDPDANHMLHLSAGKNDMEHRSTGAVAPQPQPHSREKARDDVAQGAPLPHTIRERHGLEGNGHARAEPMHTMDKTSQPERRKDGQPGRRSDEASTSLTNGYGRHHQEQNPSEGSAPAVHAPKPQAARRDTAMSGWVMVNVESQDKKRATSGQSPPPSARPGVRQRRSNSDSRILRSQNQSPVGQAPAPATMSAAAKTIAMIDAVDARERDKERSPASGLSRIFHRAKDGEKGTPAKRRAPEGGVAKNRSLEQEEREERHATRDKMKAKVHTPQGMKLTDKRIVLD